MRVKAKGNVKDASGWHKFGEVFVTEEDLGDAVEVLDAPKQEPVAEREPEPVAEPEQEAPKPKSNRRKKISE